MQGQVRNLAEVEQRMRGLECKVRDVHAKLQAARLAGREGGEESKRALEEIKLRMVEMRRAVGG